MLKTGEIAGLGIKIENGVSTRMGTGVMGID